MRPCYIYYLKRSGVHRDFIPNVALENCYWSSCRFKVSGTQFHSVLQSEEQFHLPMGDMSFLLSSCDSHLLYNTGYKKRGGGPLPPDDFDK